MPAKNIFASLASCLLLLSCESLPAFAEVTLPDGAVKGLPEKLVALDNQGNAVNSATGEYFFHVENMEYGETYTKSVQLMNLREDESYYIYFYVEPLFKNGEIDLEKGCDCTFYLDDAEFYCGDVNGKGNIDLSSVYYCTGYYPPGVSHVLKAEVTWNDIDVIQNVDNGHWLIDKDGEHILVESDTSGHVEGEIEFKWIFFASVYPIDAQHDVQTTAATESVTDSTEIMTAVTSDVITTADSNYTTFNSDDSTSISTTSTTYTTTVAVSKDSTTSLYQLFDTPLTGYLPKDGKMWLIAMGVISGMIAILLILIHKNKKNGTNQK